MKTFTAIILWVALLRSCACAESGISVAIQPLGKINSADIASVKTGIESLYAVTVEVLPEKPMPKNAYYAPRERYKASKLVDYLTSETPDRFDKVVGITTQDISATKSNVMDWGIFGLADFGERACVVSTFRLHAKNATEELFKTRLVKVVNHELGHTFGLEHCPIIGCMMQEGGGKIATVDGETGEPCAACIGEMSFLRSAPVFLIPFVK